MQRRKFLKSTAVASLGWQGLLPAWAQSAVNNSTAISNNFAGVSSLQGSEFDLTVGYSKALIAGKAARHITLNNEFPAPLLRWHEGDQLTLNVHNTLDEATSIHWHGILLPWQMDGVPGISFAGIDAGQSFTYQFKLQQAGTYWYHSHSGLQEHLGHYGPIIIDPLEPEPYHYDREYVVMLSDWSFENPERIYSKLKKNSSVYNRQQRTVFDFFRDVKNAGLNETLNDRLMWGDMRMNPTDLADVTASTFTYLINGHSSAENWTGLFRVGETIRLRFINASAMSIFNVRIPGLAMTVVQADGQNVQPVDTDEFQIGTAETFDVLVQPQADQAFTIFAESNDRSGFASATIAPRAGMQTVTPVLRPRPLLTMRDMGMSIAEPAAMDHSTMHMGTAVAPVMDHSTMHMDPAVAPVMDHSTMHMGAAVAPVMDHSTMHMGAAVPDTIVVGPGVTNLANNSVSRLHERPLGLELEPHRVLVYTDLKSLLPNPDLRQPERELQLHLTSNMERYMWSFDGLEFSEVTAPIVFQHNERIRLTLVNTTMMPHPIHLHGMFFDVVTQESATKPRKHTIVIKPAEKLSVDITADAVGEWAFHCHLLYHMHAGMMRVVSVTPAEAEVSAEESAVESAVESAEDNRLDNKKMNT